MLAKDPSKIIGLETSSIMPLLEVTPRTLPLQTNLSEALGQGYCFVTDRFSIREAKEQIEISYKNAIKSLSTAEEIAKRESIKDHKLLVIIFIKTLAENWYGREETLRWSDTASDLNRVGEKSDFFELLEDKIIQKKSEYFSVLKDDAKIITIETSEIKSYWVSPKRGNGLSIEIKTIDNAISLQEFFSELQPIVNAVYKEKITINDVIDFYHLYSLYYDGGIKEVWSCNQRFVKRHEKYLRDLENNRFSQVFKQVKIRRITK